VNKLKAHPIFVKLLSLGLPLKDYAIFGSGPMVVHRIKEIGNDLDLLARGKAWTKACSLKEPEPTSIGVGQRVALFDGEIEIFDVWGPGEWDTDELIDTAEEIEGIRFVTLENVVRWKEHMGRDKDKQHVEMIKAYLQKGP